MKICRELCDKTGGAPLCLPLFLPFAATAEPAKNENDDKRALPNFIRPGTFGVAMDQGHFKDLFFELIPPLAQQNTAGAGAGAGKLSADLMMMGFPQRLPDTAPAALCVCHAHLCGASDRLRRVRAHGRVVAASRVELSSLVPHQVLLCRVSRVTDLGGPLNSAPPLGPTWPPVR